MEQVERLPLADTPAPRMRVGLRAAVVLYLVVVLVAPVGALLSAVVEIGPRALGAALASSAVLRPLGTSLGLAALAVGVNAVVGSVGAVTLTRRRSRIAPLVEALGDLPLAISPVMTGLAFLLLFGRDGVLAPLAGALDLQVVFALPGVALVTLFVTLPYALRESTHLLRELGFAEEEAAATLGATGLQTFWQVTLPKIRPALERGLAMTAARSLGEFGAVLIVGGSIAGRTRTATTLVHDALEERERAVAYGMALLLAGLSAVLVILIERRGRRDRSQRS